MNPKSILIVAAALTLGAGVYAVLHMALNSIIGKEKPSYMPDGRNFMGKLNSSFNNYKDEIEKATIKLYNRNPEKIYITNAQGLKLCGHWIQAANPKRTVVMMHGFRSSWDRDFSSAVDFFVNNGCNLLIVEQRARGAGMLITTRVSPFSSCSSL